MNPQLQGGGPAFPIPGDAACVSVTEGNTTRIVPLNGITQRAYLAGKALQGFCANPSIFASNQQSGWDLVNCTDQQLAQACVRLADAVMHAAAESPKP